MRASREQGERKRRPGERSRSSRRYAHELLRVSKPLCARSTVPHAAEPCVAAAASARSSRLACAAFAAPLASLPSHVKPRMRFAELQRALLVRRDESPPEPEPLAVEAPGGVCQQPPGASSEKHHEPPWS